MYWSTFSGHLNKSQCLSSLHWICHRCNTSAHYIAAKLYDMKEWIRVVNAIIKTELNWDFTNISLHAIKWIHTQKWNPIIVKYQQKKRNCLLYVHVPGASSVLQRSVSQHWGLKVVLFCPKCMASVTHRAGSVQFFSLLSNVLPTKTIN